MEYENAQKRILEIFTQWKAPPISRSSCSSFEWVTGVVYDAGLRRSVGCS